MSFLIVVLKICFLQLNLLIEKFVAEASLKLLRNPKVCEITISEMRNVENYTRLGQIWLYIIQGEQTSRL
jgi:hypothetical protein